MFFFLLFGRGPRPRPNSKKKKKHAPAQTAKKKKNTPPPLLSFFFCCLGGWLCSFFCCLGGGRVFFFAVWAGGVFFFCCLGGGVFCFCCLGGGVFFFLLFGPGACFFFAVWAGDRSSLTYPSAWLVFKRPNNKRDRTAKKKHGFLGRTTKGAYRVQIRHIQTHLTYRKTNRQTNERDKLSIHKFIYSCKRACGCCTMFPPQSVLLGSVMEEELLNTYLAKGPP